jgi:hypothetical protein
MAGSKVFPGIVGAPAVHKVFEWSWSWNEEDQSWSFGNPYDGGLFMIQRFPVVTA